MLHVQRALYVLYVQRALYELYVQKPYMCYVCRGPINSSLV